MSLAKAKEYVERRNSSYYVAGSRVSLASLVHEFRKGVSPEGIRDNFETLNLEQVYGAIAYYLARQQEIDAHLDQQDKDFEAARRNQAHVTPKLRRKLQRARHQAVKR
jgi:uncharacterized protein (DUF433 family)